MARTDSLSARFMNVQEGMRQLMVLARRIHTGEQAALPETLRLFEDGIFVMAGELIAIPRELNARELMVDQELEELVELSSKLNRAAARLDAVERQTVPADSFSTERFDVEIDKDAEVVVVRQRSPATQSGQVYVPEEFRPTGFLQDMAVPSADVIPFVRADRDSGGRS